MTACLVTGGAGFIGSNFVHALAGRGDRPIVILDSLTYAGNLANIEPLIDGREVVFVRGDIRDEALVGRLLEEHGIDVVVHFAAESHVDRSILGPSAFLETNVIGTMTLLQAARAAWGADPADKRFVHVSTDEVYGSLSPNDPPFDEQSPYKPRSPYAASKASSDHLVRAWHETYDFPAIVTNCSNNYGPWQFPEKLIPLMIVNALENKPLPVYGDGRQVRDWLHVADHCEALLAIMTRGRIGETYCIGGRTERFNLQIVESICDLVDERREQANDTARSLIRHVEDRPGHDRRYAMEPAKLEAELGWRPQRSFEAALAETVDWYLAHGDWIDQIRSGDYRTYYEDQYGQRLKEGP